MLAILKQRLLERQGRVIVGIYHRIQRALPLDPAKGASLLWNPIIVRILRALDEVTNGNDEVISISSIEKTSFFRSVFCNCLAMDEMDEVFCPKKLC